MGTMRAIYVRLKQQDDLATLRRLLRGQGTLSTEPGKDFAWVEWPSFYPPEELLQRLSAKLDTDVIWLVFQSVTDAFAFQHWTSGVQGRTLDFSCFATGEQRQTWEQVAGVPEPWEPPELSAATIGEYSHFNSRETARAMAHYYHLPGWGL
jgi:hypothetical protein